jgi:hypothetical protein
MISHSMLSTIRFPPAPAPATYAALDRSKIRSAAKSVRIFRTWLARGRPSARAALSSSSRNGFATRTTI